MHNKAEDLLKNALKKDVDFFIILEELFPDIAKRAEVQKFYSAEKKEQ